MVADDENSERAASASWDAELLQFVVMQVTIVTSTNYIMRNRNPCLLLEKAISLQIITSMSTSRKSKLSASPPLSDQGTHMCVAAIVAHSSTG